MIPTCDFSLSSNPQVHLNSISVPSQHSFHSFCKEELPPLSPLTAKTFLHANRTPTPKKLHFSMK